MSEKLLTVREVSHILGISEKDVIELSEQRKIPAYKIGGVYLRFRREQVEQFKASVLESIPHSKNEKTYGPLERIGDFIYFNDFYILSLIIIAILVFVVVEGIKG